MTDLPFRNISKGTIVYKIIKYDATNRFDLRPGDIILGVDEFNDMWILERQEAR